MAQFKVVMFFQEFRQGWSEVWYFDQATITDVRSKMQGVILGRQGVLDGDGVILAMRVSQLTGGPPLLTSLVAINLAGVRGDPTLGPPNSGPDVTPTACLMNVQTAAGKNRSLLIRGLSDDDVLRDDSTGQSAPHPGLSAALAVYRDTLIAAGASIRYQDQAQTKFGVIQVREFGADPTLTEIVTGVAPSVVAGDKVRFFRVPKPTLPWLKGVWTVVSTSAVGFTIEYVYPLKNDTPTPEMKYQKVAYLTSPVSAMQFREFRSRKTGRPFDLTRGRAVGIKFRR